MNPEQMKRLAELRQKKAFTMTPVMGLSDVVTLYLQEISKILSPLAYQATGQYPKIYIDAGEVTLSMEDPDTGDADTLQLSINFDARVLRARLVADASQGGSEIEKEWKLSRIQNIAAAKIARFIYHEML
jgi:hypothetical protein